jgi:hypothetical protein
MKLPYMKSASSTHAGAGVSPFRKLMIRAG